MFGLHEYFGFFPLFRLTRPTQYGGGECSVVYSSIIIYDEKLSF